MSLNDEYLRLHPRLKLPQQPKSEFTARVYHPEPDTPWVSFVTEDHHKSDGVAERWRVVYISPVTFNTHSAAQWHGKKIIKELS